LATIFVMGIYLHLDDVSVQSNAPASTSQTPSRTFSLHCTADVMYARHANYIAYI